MPFGIPDLTLPPDFQPTAIAKKRRNPVDPPGRPKGLPNKFTRDIKNAVLQAAANVGDEDYGGRGLVGYCEDLARNHKRAFAALLGKMMPLTISGDGTTSAYIGTVNVLSVPVDHYLNAADIARLSQPGLIEHSPPSEPASGPPPELDEEAQLRAELGGLSDEQLMQRAIKCGLDPNLLNSLPSTSGD
jgi:hypothetical protein